MLIIAIIMLTIIKMIIKVIIIITVKIYTKIDDEIETQTNAFFVKFSSSSIMSFTYCLILVLTEV